MDMHIHYTGDKNLLVSEAFKLTKGDQLAIEIQAGAFSTYFLSLLRHSEKTFEYSVMLDNEPIIDWQSVDTRKRPLELIVADCLGKINQHSTIQAERDRPLYDAKEYKRVTASLPALKKA